MKRFLTIAVLSLALLLSACGTKPWVVVEGVRSWTDRNFESMEQRQLKMECAEVVGGVWKPGRQHGSDECTFMRRYIVPYMNILKHALAAAEAIRIEDDVMLASECYDIAKIAANLGVSYSGLTNSLLNKDMEAASAEIDGLKAFIATNAGVAREPPEKEGWLQRAWDWVW